MNTNLHATTRLQVQEDKWHKSVSPSMRTPLFIAMLLYCVYFYFFHTHRFTVTRPCPWWLAGVSAGDQAMSLIANFCKPWLTAQNPHIHTQRPNSCKSLRSSFEITRQCFVSCLDQKCEQMCRFFNELVWIRGVRSEEGVASVMDPAMVFLFIYLL